MTQFSAYPPAIPREIEIPEQPVYRWLEEAAEKWAGQDAFVFMGKALSWAQLNAMADRFAAGLQEAGLQKGDRVGLFLPNSPEFVAAYYGVLKAGGVAVNFNPLSAPLEIANQINDCGVRFMISFNLKVLQDKLKPRLKDTQLEAMIVCDFCHALPFVKGLAFRFLKASDMEQDFDTNKTLYFKDFKRSDFTPVAIDPARDLAVIQYTGGTTGVPKGAMLTHRNIVANTEQSAAWFYKARPGQERMLGVLPFFHVFAMTAIMNLSIRNGFTIYATPRFELEQTLKLIDKIRPHYFPAVPAIYNAINNHPKAGQYDLSSLLYCVSGGAPLPVEVKKSFEDKTGCVVVEGYGLTESSPVVCVNPIEGENRPGSIGLPVPSTQIKLCDPETGALVAEGKRGELCVKGPQVMQGYWNRDEDTQNVLKDGWLHTGDVAEIDADGYVYIVDRIKDLILTNGYNVYPRHVEEAIYAHEAVEECIVAGINDAQRGEVVKAWIKLKDGAELDRPALKDFLKERLSAYEMPRQIEFRDEPLPKTMIGKLSRKDLLAEEK